MEDCVVIVNRDPKVEEAVMSMSTSKMFCFVCAMSTTSRRGMGGPLRRRSSYLRQVNSFMMVINEGGGTDFFGGDGGVNDLQTSCATCFVVIKHVFDIQQKIADLQKELEEIVQSTRMKRNMLLSSSSSFTSTNGVICDPPVQVKIEKDEDIYEIQTQQSPDNIMESLPMKSVRAVGVDKEIDEDRDVESYQRKKGDDIGRPKRNLNAKRKKKEEEPHFVWDALSGEGMSDDNDDDYNDGDDDKDDSCQAQATCLFFEASDKDEDYIVVSAPKRRKTKKTNETEVKRSRTKSSSSFTAKGQEEQICEQCGKKFPTQRHLSHHIRRVHSIKPHACVLCEKRFDNPSTLRQHIKFRHDHLHSITSSTSIAEQVSWSCSMCGKKLSTFRNRVIHEIKVCNVTTWSDEELNKLSIHFLKCAEPECHQMFPKQKDLFRHSLTHTGDPELLAKISKERKEKRKRGTKVCHICGLTVVSDQLKYHIRRVHIGETTYQCGECGIKFFGRTDLVKHTRAHEERRNASSNDWRKDRGLCPYCAKDFLGSRLLKRHLREEHGQENRKEITTE